MDYKFDFVMPEGWENFEPDAYESSIIEAVSEKLAEAGIKYRGELGVLSWGDRNGVHDGASEIIEYWLGYPVTGDCLTATDFYGWDYVLATDDLCDLVAVLVDVDRSGHGKGFMCTWTEEDFWDNTEVGFRWHDEDAEPFCGLKEFAPGCQYWKEAEGGVEWLGLDDEGKKARGFVTDKELGIE